MGESPSDPVGGGPQEEPAPTQPSPPPSPSPPPAPRRLYRSRTDRIISGVCGGMAEYFGVDPAIIRIGLVVVAIFTGGAAILGYLIAWLVVPEGEAGASPARSAGEREPSDQGRLIVGGVLVVAGAVWLFATLFGDLFRFRPFLALLVIAVGVVLVLQGSRR